MWHLKEVVDGLVAHGRLGLALAHQVLQVLLEALLVPQEAHGDVIVRHALVQRGQEGPVTEAMVGVIITFKGEGLWGGIWLRK